MTLPMIASTQESVPAARTGRPALWTEDEIESFVELLEDRPALLSPLHYYARSTARGHAEKLRTRLARHDVKVSIRVWETDEPPHAGQYRWAVIRQQESTP